MAHSTAVEHFMMLQMSTVARFATAAVHALDSSRRNAAILAVVQLSGAVEWSAWLVSQLPPQRFVLSLTSLAELSFINTFSNRF
jgi:hypothetical protein